MNSLTQDVNDSIFTTVKTPCAVCDSISDRPLTTDNGFRIGRCVECGFVFVNPRPAQDSLIKLYANAEQNYCVSESYEPLEYELPVLTKIVREIQKYVRSGRLFEVGCGRGDFLRVAKSSGFSVSGCDLFAGSKLNIDGVELHDGTLRAANLGANEYDVVVIRNTLEHLFDPRGELEEIRRILKPDGYLYLKVPNVAFEHGFGCRLVVRRSHAFEAPYHLNHFSPRTLRLLLKRTRLQFMSWSIEQPTIEPEWKSNLLRQTSYRAIQAMRFITAGLFFPKILLAAIAKRPKQCRGLFYAFSIFSLS
jgi:SAM-dependent methyltransferase